MRSIWKSVRLAGGSLNAGLCGVVLWFLLVGVFASAYVTGTISVGTLVFAEICALAVGVIAVIIGKQMSEPPEIVEQILYRTEHPTR
jgi:hypothetical protein